MEWLIHPSTSYPYNDSYFYWPCVGTATSTGNIYQGLESTYSAQATMSSTSIYLTVRDAWVSQSQMQNQAAELYQQQLAAPAIIRSGRLARPPQMTPEQVAERDARYQAAEAKRTAAARRAEELMLAHLTPAQRESVKVHGWFIVQGGKSRLNYQIRPNTHAGNIEVDHDGRRSRLCCHTDYSIPVFDNALAQKLMLETDEEAFLRIANRTAA